GRTGRCLKCEGSAVRAHEHLPGRMSDISLRQSPREGSIRGCLVSTGTVIVRSNQLVKRAPRSALPSPPSTDGVCPARAHVEEDAPSSVEVPTRPTPPCAVISAPVLLSCSCRSRVLVS